MISDFHYLNNVEEGGARVACGARVDASLLYVIAQAKRIDRYTLDAICRPRLTK